MKPRQPVELTCSTARCQIRSELKSSGEDEKRRLLWRPLLALRKGIFVLSPQRFFGCALTDRCGGDFFL
jgi:hypothetical protein